MTLTQQWGRLNLTGNSLHVLFPAKGSVSYRQIILAISCRTPESTRLMSGLTRRTELHSGNRNIDNLADGIEVIMLLFRKRL